MIKVRPFTCKRDGLKIRGFEFRPAKGDNFPVVVVSHQFMANQLFVMKYAIMMARRGYCAYCYDFNGGGRVNISSGKTTDMTLFTEVDDLKAVIEYVKTRKYNNPDELTLWGCSQGGFVSAVVAAQLKEKVRQLILFYPALCMPDDARSGQMLSAKFDVNDVPDIIDAKLIVLGKEYVTTMLDKDPYDLIRGYTGDVLLVHGKGDVIVDFKYSLKALEEYKNNGANIKFKKIHLPTHLFFGPWDSVAKAQVKKFINK